MINTACHLRAPNCSTDPAEKGPEGPPARPAAKYLRFVRRNTATPIRAGCSRDRRNLFWLQSGIEFIAASAYKHTEM